MKYSIRCGKKHQVVIQPKSDFSISSEISVGRKTFQVRIQDTHADGRLKTVIVNNKVFPVQVDRRNDGFPSSVRLNGIPYPIDIEKVESTRYRPPKTDRTVSGKVVSSLPGQIVSILVKEGDSVQKGQPLLILESMKMENEVLAPKNGQIAKLLVTSGQVVMKNHLLLEID